MNTAYRVWDGEKMHYGHEEGLRLTIENDGSWSLRVAVLIPKGANTWATLI